MSLNITVRSTVLTAVAAFLARLVSCKHHHDEDFRLVPGVWNNGRIDAFEALLDGRVVIAGRRDSLEELEVRIFQNSGVEEVISALELTSVAGGLDRREKNIVAVRSAPEAGSVLVAGNFDRAGGVVRPGIVEVRVEPTGGAPYQAVVTRLGEDSRRIRWQGPSEATAYVIERRLHPAAGWEFLASVDGLIREWVDEEDLPILGEPAYRVRVQSIGGLLSLPSGAASAGSLQEIPDAPSRLEAFVIDPEKVELAWSDVEHESQYVLESRTKGRFGSQFGTWQQM